ncbi:hypothetical protein, conserved [Trypanosoma brucei brucei TREU927]|uniref:Uncharacterized protein n=1 Tax=Trypanosoma brucei brucei (strain 927/4 GUTat10.1) TaxID=185431 RepID=Q389F0_TRYB2|nr:hypothetical protein, conserved [Trypanosoma brucei brucei TREU927]EAN78570.1 hypothetical protein, conserved [Trypanosoma brucei brucei TREU927]
MQAVGETSVSGGWAEDEDYLLGARSCGDGATVPLNIAHVHQSATTQRRREFSEIFSVGNSMRMHSDSPVASSIDTCLIGSSGEERLSPTVADDQRVLECLASIAYLVGSPLQRSQPTAAEPVQKALCVVRKLLQRGVNPEQIINVIESRDGVGGG